MRFIIEWTKIRKLIIIVLLSLLMAYITIRLIIMNNEINQLQEIEIEEIEKFNI